MIVIVAIIGDFVIVGIIIITLHYDCVEVAKFHYTW